MKIKLNLKDSSTTSTREAYTYILNKSNQNIS